MPKKPQQHQQQRSLSRDRRQAPATRQRPKGPTRAERIAAAEAARRRRTRLRWGMVAAALVVVVGVIVALVVADRRAQARRVAQLEAGGCRYDQRADSDAGPGRNHVTGWPTYQVDPPAGGNHLATAAPAGVYAAERVPPDGQLVHALEHGDVILWHRPDAPEEVMAGLREIAERYPTDVLVVPRPSLTDQVAATAWHHRLLCGTSHPASLDLFVSTFRDKGPERVEDG